MTNIREKVQTGLFFATEFLMFAVSFPLAARFPDKTKRAVDQRVIAKYGSPNVCEWTGQETDPKHLQYSHIDQPTKETDPEALKLMQQPSNCLKVSTWSHRDIHLRAAHGQLRNNFDPDQNLASASLLQRTLQRLGIADAHPMPDLED